MYIQELDYYRPTELPELLDLLDTYREEAKLLAGGTDLMVQMKFRRWPQRRLIDMKRVSGLNRCGYEGDWFVIGCNTTLSELLDTPEVKNDFGALWDAIDELADVQIRNRGTLAGNICNASPAADAVPALVVYDAVVVASSKEGNRDIPVGEFLTGPGKTCLRSNEAVTEIRLPRPGDGTYASFQKLSRTNDDIATINAAVRVDVDEAGRCRASRIAMGAVGPTVRRSPQGEQALLGKVLDAESAREAAAGAANDAAPITDVRASAEYRKLMSQVLVERALLDIGDKVNSIA